QRCGRGLRRGQVPALPGLRLVERRLAEKEVGAAGEDAECRGRSGVGREREPAAAGLDAPPVGRLGIVADGVRRDREPGRFERLAVRVFADREYLAEATCLVVQVG